MICLLLTTFRWLTRHTDRQIESERARVRVRVTVTVAWRGRRRRFFRSRVSELCWQWKIQAMKIETFWLRTASRRRRRRRCGSLCVVYVNDKRNECTHSKNKRKTRKKQQQQQSNPLWLWREDILHHWKMTHYEDAIYGPLRKNYDNSLRLKWSQMAAASETGSERKKEKLDLVFADSRQTHLHTQ